MKRFNPRSTILFLLLLTAAIGLLLQTAGCYCKKYNTASVYVVAHHDDWQLFMGQDFLKDVADKNRQVLLIITTCGAEQQRFSAVRETGAMASVNHALGINKPGMDTVAGYSKLNGFTVPSFRAANVTVLFLRIADGNITGKGFPALNNVSMTKLQNGEIQDITTTDTLNHFKNWDELADFMRTITEAEIGNKVPVTLHIADTSTAVNPNDHPDHIAAAHLALKAYASIKADHILHQEYNTENLPANLNSSESLAVQQLFNAYNDTVTHMMGFCTTCYTDSYQKWCARSYKRKI